MDAAGVADLGDRTLEEGKSSGEVIVQFPWGDRVGRAFSRGISGFRVEEAEEATARTEGGMDSVDVILAQGGVDGAKTGVLEDPVEGGVEVRRQVADIAEAVGFGTRGLDSAGAADGRGGDIEPGHPRTLGGEEADIFPDPATGNEDVAGGGILAEPCP